MAKPSKAEKEQRYSGEVLARSKHFHGVQQDFCKIILGKESYTIKEAKDKISKFLERS